jgi:hypothetical protein
LGVRSELLVVISKDSSPKGEVSKDSYSSRRTYRR